jgi:hypothetical protein
MARQCATEMGTANIAAPAGYVPTNVSVFPQTCLAEDGSCSGRPGIGMSVTFNDNSGNSLGFRFTVPAREGAATYAVPAPTWDGAVFQQGTFRHSSDGSEIAPINALSGTVVVEHSTADAFRATFDLELESPDQRFHFSITGGHAETTGCRIVSYGPHCQVAD